MALPTPAHIWIFSTPLQQINYQENIRMVSGRYIGRVLKTSGPVDFKSAPAFENWQRFVGEIEEKKYRTLCASTVFLDIK